VSVADYASAYAPGAQKRGSVVVLDEREVTVQGERRVRMAVTHANPKGTDATDLSDFAAEAARRCGFEIPHECSPLLDRKPIPRAALT
jgi:hypothetical protein